MRQEQEEGGRYDAGVFHVSPNTILHQKVRQGLKPVPHL